MAAGATHAYYGRDEWAEHAPEEATASGERLLHLPDSRVTAYEVERRDQPPVSEHGDEQGEDEAHQHRQ